MTRKHERTEWTCKYRAGANLILKISLSFETLRGRSDRKHVLQSEPQKWAASKVCEVNSCLEEKLVLAVLGYLELFDLQAVIITI